MWRRQQPWFGDGGALSGNTTGADESLSWFDAPALSRDVYFGRESLSWFDAAALSRNVYFGLESRSGFDAASSRGPDSKVRVQSDRWKTAWKSR